MFEIKDLKNSEPAALLTFLSTQAKSNLNFIQISTDLMNFICINILIYFLCHNPLILLLNLLLC